MKKLLFLVLSSFVILAAKDLENSQDMESKQSIRSFFGITGGYAERNIKYSPSPFSPNWDPFLRSDIKFRGWYAGLDFGYEIYVFKYLVLRPMFAFGYGDLRAYEDRHTFANDTIIKNRSWYLDAQAWMDLMLGFPITQGEQEVAIFLFGGAGAGYEYNSSSLKQEDEDTDRVLNSFYVKNHISELALRAGISIRIGFAHRFDIYTVMPFYDRISMNNSFGEKMTKVYKTPIEPNNILLSYHFFF